MKTGAVLACAVAMLASMVSAADFSRDALSQGQIKGVNLGGWLVVERFIKPSLFSKTGIDFPTHDEYSLLSALGDKAEAYMEEHYSSFITESDFEDMAALGVQAVRIPVGHYTVLDDKPFVGNSLKYLDKAFQWAAKNGIWVLVDLHTAPGGQNPWDHSGRANYHQWKSNPQQYIELTLQVIDKLAQRYGTKPNFYGFGVLNEPFQVSLGSLNEFYKQAYKVVRQYSPEGYVIFFEGFGDQSYRQTAAWAKSGNNAVFDAHTYTTFGGMKTVSDAHNGLAYAGRHNQELAQLLGVTIGEFCMAMADINSPYSVGYHKLWSDSEYKEYWQLQKEAFKSAKAYFFWNYKLGDSESDRIPEWSFVESAKRGWLSYLEGGAKANATKTIQSSTADNTATNVTTDTVSTNSPTKAPSGAAQADQRDASNTKATTAAPTQSSSAPVSGGQAMGSAVLGVLAVACFAMAQQL